MDYKSSETDWQKDWYSDYQGEVIVVIEGREYHFTESGEGLARKEYPSQGSVVAVGVEAA